MYNKKYRLEKIEEFNGHNHVYDGVENRIAYPAYFNIGERGCFVYVEKTLFGEFIRSIHTSVVKNVEYFNDMAYEDDYIIVETENTRFKFRLIEDD